MTRAATAVAAALAAIVVAHPAPAATVLTFEQVLDRAERSHAISPSALSAAAALEKESRFGFPVIRAETSASSAENLDIFAQNVFRAGALTALLAVDYPLADGGVSDKRSRIAKLDAESFRQRMREVDDDLFRETLDAVASLYAAQEKLRVVRAGLQHAVELRDRARSMLGMQEISNVTAARWQDEALVAESQLLELDLQRLEAETHVKQLIGDASSDPIEIVIPIGEAPAAVTPPPNPDPLLRGDRGVVRATMQYERKRLALEEAEAARRPQVLLSAFGGVAALGDWGRDADRRYGLYGLRFSVTLPMFDTAAARRVAEARLEAEEARMQRETTTELIRRQTSTLWLGIAALEKRIALLEQMVEISRKREESMARLVAAGVRSENDVAEAATDRTRREGDLVGARIDLWKYRQMLHRRTEEAAR